MKTIALPLLAASSASAQKRADMAQDFAVAAPILIADQYTADDCNDAGNAVSTATTALATLNTALATLETDLTPLNTAVTTAREAKTTAIDAVIAADAALKTNLAADDTAQGTLLTLKAALDQTKYNKATATAEKTAAVTAAAAATAAKDAAIITQTALNTAATQALAHYTYEQTQTATATTAVAAALAAKNTASGNQAGLDSLYTAAKVLSDAKDTEYNTKQATKLYQNALKVKHNASLVTMTTNIDATSNGSAAKTTADAEAILATKSGTVTTDGGTWTTLSLATTGAFQTYKTEVAKTAANQLYGVVHATDGCAGSLSATSTSSEADCKTACAGKRAWATDLTTTTAESSVANAATQANSVYCYGVDWKTSGTVCKFALTYPVVVLAGGADIGTKCESRTLSVNAKDQADKRALSTNAVASYTGALTTALTAYDTQYKLVIDTFGAKEVATALKTAFDTINTATNTASGTADSEFVTVTGEKTTLDADTALKLTNKTNNETLVSTTTATWTAAGTAKTAQEAEEAAQLLAKNLADADKTAQDTLVTSLTTAETTANTLVTTKTTAETTATTAQTTAQTAYDAQVTAAGATKTAVTAPLAELVTKRATAATATTALGTALTNVAAQQALIDAKQAEVKTKTAERLAAIVACKETKFDLWTQNLADAVAARKVKIDAIEALLDGAATPARGKAGARCEKALSNGTWRPKRGETTCDAGLCCGAARITEGATVMTIETCQAEGTAEYTYTKPRGPLDTTFTTDKVPFTCIEGAKKLAAAASALATAVYMLA